MAHAIRWSRPRFAPHAPYTVSDASFERIRMLSDQLDLPVHCHVHETAHEVAESQQKHGQRPLARLDRLGLVNDRLIAVHMTQLTDAEIALCAERGVSVAHCPESNLKLASGFCPVAKLQPRRRQPRDRHRRRGQQQRPGHVRRDAQRRAAGQGRGRRRVGARCRRCAARGDARRREGARLRSTSSARSSRASRPTWSASTSARSKRSRCTTSSRSWSTRAGASRSATSGSRARRKLREQVLVDMDPAALVANARQWRERIAAVTRSRDEHACRDDNFSQAELDKFNELAHRWWDPEGPQKALHALNPARLGYVAGRVPLRGARVLDVGCGGGLLSEALAREGAQVTAIDLAPDLVRIAQTASARVGRRGRLPAGRPPRRSRPSMPGALRRDHLHGNARARARSGLGAAAPARRCSSRAGACSCRRSTARRRHSRWPSSAPNTSHACCRRARTSTATSSSRRNWPAWLRGAGLRTGGRQRPGVRAVAQRRAAVARAPT